MQAKPPLNEVARIVNSHFLQSSYEGKDWESVRSDLIQELTAHIKQIEVEARKDEALIRLAEAELDYDPFRDWYALEPSKRGFGNRRANYGWRTHKSLIVKQAKERLEWLDKIGPKPKGSIVQGRLRELTSSRQPVSQTKDSDTRIDSGITSDTPQGK